jgi:glycosyltransferase involved in cell wall biosynthesis
MNEKERSARTISIIVPAYNEEGNLKATVEGVAGIAVQRFSDYEILIFDDYSVDKTGEIADDLASVNSHVLVHHNQRNMGFGYNYTKGVELARMEYVMMIPGDNEITDESIGAICDMAGSADIIVPYTVNTEVRPVSRRIISKTFTAIMNVITGLHLRYYNGPCIHNAGIIKSIPMTTWGYAYMASILARLIRSGHSYLEVGMYLKQRGYGGSKAFKLKNIARVGKTLLDLFWELRVRKPAGRKKG